MSTETPVKDEKFTKCIHGLFWSSCNVCKEKSLEEIATEKKFIRKSLETSSAFDYQESETLEKLEEDRDYDLDDMRMG